MSDDRDMVADRYELGDVLGRGGMAEVREAVDVRLGRPVAVKRLRGDLAADPTFQARFRREAQAAAKLNHPSIVSIYDTGEEPDPVSGGSIPYIVMELVEGRTLGEVLRAEQSVPPQRALQLTREVLDALAHSHQAGIVHRDIKPTNVMLTPAGAVKVMDFGIARAVADTSTSLTRTAGVIGTAHYLSPEQARGEIVDARSDIYSVGCLLYELLVGRPPFMGDSPVSVAYQHVREPPAPPSALNPAVGPEIDAIALRALAKDPADRYQTAAEMSADIGRVLVGQQPVAAAPPPGGTANLTPTVLLGQAPAAAAGPLAGEPATPTEPLAGLAGGTTAPVLPPAAEAPYAQGGRRPPERRFWPTVLVALLVIALLAGLGYGIYRVLSGLSGTQTVAVPNVVNLTESRARDELTARQLKVEVKTVAGTARTKGKVVAQDPKAGTRVGKSTTVTITVSRGPDTGGDRGSAPPSSGPQTSAPPSTQRASSEPATSEPATSNPPTSEPPSSRPPTSSRPTATSSASTGAASGSATSAGAASGRSTPT